MHCTHCYCQTTHASTNGLCPACALAALVENLANQPAPAKPALPPRGTLAVPHSANPPWPWQHAVGYNAQGCMVGTVWVLPSGTAQRTKGGRCNKAQTAAVASVLGPQVTSAKVLPPSPWFGNGPVPAGCRRAC